MAFECPNCLEDDAVEPYVCERCRKRICNYCVELFWLDSYGGVVHETLCEECKIFREREGIAR